MTNRYRQGKYSRARVRSVREFPLTRRHLQVRHPQVIKYVSPVSCALVTHNLPWPLNNLHPQVIKYVSPASCGLVTHNLPWPLNNLHPQVIKYVSPASSALVTNDL